MNTNRIIQIVVLIIVAGVALFVVQKKQQPVATDFASCQNLGGTLVDGHPVTCIAPNGETFQEETSIEADVVLEQPSFGDLVTSPLTVKGKARGFWFFEANIPVTLKDQKGNILAQKGFQAKGEWMTEDYVEFEDTLEFELPGDAEYGVLIVEKDNPSGLPELDASFAVPVRFQASID